MTNRLAAALAALEEARSIERAIRTLVAEGKEGASALSTAEYRVNGALRRVERLGGLRGAEGAEQPPDAA